MKTRKPEDGRSEIASEPPVYNKKTYFYIGIAATVLGVAAFGLTFTALGVYALIASVLFALAALSFLGTQQKKHNFKGVFFAKIAAYALLAVAVAFFIGGIIWSSL